MTEHVISRLPPPPPPPPLEPTTGADNLPENGRRGLVLFFPFSCLFLSPREETLERRAQGEGAEAGFVSLPSAAPHPPRRVLMCYAASAPPCDAGM